MFERFVFSFIWSRYFLWNDSMICDMMHEPLQSERVVRGRKRGTWCRSKARMFWIYFLLKVYKQSKFGLKKQIKLTFTWCALWALLPLCPIWRPSPDIWCWTLTGCGSETILDDESYFFCTEKIYFFGFV